MTEERLQEIRQMLEAWRNSDANQRDAEKTGVVVKLLTELNRPPGKALQSNAGT